MAAPFFKMTLLRYNSHTIKFTHSTRVSLLTGREFSTINFRSLSSPQKETSNPLAVTPCNSESLASIHLLSVFIDLPILGISYECTIVTVLFHLACFQGSSILWHYQYSIAFHGWIISICQLMNICFSPLFWLL